MRPEHPSTVQRTVLLSLMVATGLPTFARGDWRGLASHAAQPTAKVGTSSVPEPNYQPGAATVSERVAKDVARIALLDLQASGKPEADSYRIAALMLEMAHELSPRDADILRMLIDAWNEAGDRARVIAHTKTLAKLDPRDLVAQLRLLSSGISSLQSVEARLAAYERLLGPKWEKQLDQSVRSRLALDAALLLREKGDADGFVKRLGDATAWDATNKDAASLAATFFSLRVDDPVGRFSLLVNLLNADPFDPETHLAMARELAAGGAYKQSKRFYETYQSLMGRRSQRVNPSEVAEYQVATWNVEGAEYLLKSARLSVERQRAELETKRRELIAIDAPVDEIPDPENLRLPMESERARASCAAAFGDEGQLDYAASELETTYVRQLKLLQDPKALPAGMTEEVAKTTILQLTAELVWMRLWTGRNLGNAGLALEELEKNASTNKDTVQRMMGWYRIRKNELDTGEQLLRPLAESDVLAAMGLALCAELRGSKDDAIRQYQTIFDSNMGTLVGACARTRLIALSGTEPPQSPGSIELDKLARGVPPWLEGMIDDPHRVVSISAEPMSPRIGPLDPIYLRIRVINLSPMALAIGPDCPINSTLLLVPQLLVGLSPVSGGNSSSVVRLDRKLRLLPQESMEIVVWVDSGILGYIMDQAGVVASEVRWRVVQGFVVDEEGMFLPGPMNATADTGSVMREGSPKNTLSMESLAKFIDSGSVNDLADGLLVIKNVAQAPPAPPPSASSSPPADEEATRNEEKAMLARSLAKRYGNLDRLGKLQVLAKLPTKSQAPWLAPLDEAMSKETDPAVVQFLLLTRATEPTDPLFVVASSTADPKLKEAAPLVRARIEAGIDTYSRVGMGEPKKSASESKPPAETVPRPTSTPVSK